MNIFILDNDKEKCAQYHNNKHVVKMILESAQILSTVARQNGIDFGYKPTHAKHPCTLWTGKSLDNFTWLVDFVYHLHDEWRHRFNHNKTHKSYEVVRGIMGRVANDGIDIPSIGLTPFAQAMPDQYKSDNTVQAYRNYYIGEKKHLADWGKREIPDWYEF